MRINPKRWAGCVALSLAAWTQPFTAEKSTSQGQVLHLTGSTTDTQLTAAFGSREFPVFIREGRAFTLIPIPVNMAPGPHELVVRGTGGVERQRLPVIVRKTPFRTQNIRATKGMKAIRPAPGEVEKMRALAALVTPVRYFEDRFIRPTEHCQNSPFGVQRLHNGKPTGSYHRGADQRSPEGTLVAAPASGIVAVAERGFLLNGGTVGIDHGYGLTSHYLHLSKVFAVEGRKVQQGDVIGEVGATGFATGAHLHWGTSVHATPVDPNVFVALTPCAAAPVRPTARKKR